MFSSLPRLLFRFRIPDLAFPYTRKKEGKRMRQSDVDARKHLKMEDISRIVLLAKPEYKKLAGNR